MQTVAAIQGLEDKVRISSLDIEIRGELGYLDVARKEDMTSRRLRASITKGRVVSIEELCSPPADPGIPNHIPPINRLTAWWHQITGTDWLQRRTLDQLEALKRDFAPVDAIRGQIDLAIEHRRQRRFV